MGICASRSKDQNQATNANIAYRTYTNNNDVQKVKQNEQPISSEPLQQIQNYNQNQQVDQDLYAKQINVPVTNWNQQQPIGDNVLGNNEGALSDAELARRQEEMLRENLAGDTTKPGSGILEMIQDSFNRLNKIIELLGPAYTKMPADDQQQ